MITKFNQYLKESVLDKMTGKSFDELFKYDNYKPILRTFDDITYRHNDLKILDEQLPVLLDSKIEDLRYFVIKDDLFTGDDKGNMVYAKDYLDTLEDYIKGSSSEIVKIPELTSGIIESVLVFKDKKLAIIHSVYSTMVAINKNIFPK